MTAVIIIVMCIVALGISFSRISELRARNRAEREEAQKQAQEASTPDSVSENAPTAPSGTHTFADYLDAENAPTLTRAQLDEWQRDFVLACKYGRRPPKGNAPFMRYLQGVGFFLPYKSPLPLVRAVKGNEKALPLPSPQKSLAACCKKRYKEYLKSGPAPVMR